MKKILFLFVLILYANCCYSEVSSWVDNNPVHEGDMFNLYVEAKNVKDPEEPDISGIKGFQIINKSEQNQTSIIGNKITRIVKWTYVLIATSQGNYQIPSLKVGNEYTNPILLEVVKSPQNKQNEIVRLNLELSSNKVYQQEQIIFELNIIRNGLQLVNESITPFDVEGIKIEKISEKSYQKINKGTKQLITQILYVAVPEKNGTIVIPQIRYQGDEINGVNLGSIFQKFGSYSQNRGRRIFSESSPQKIEVLPIPEGIIGWWLPVKKLIIEEKWESNPQVFIVGQPITRTISIYVDGAYSYQIPELKIKYPNGIKSYSDQPILETKKNQKGLKSKRVEKFALIPSISGEMKLPEIKIEWWDVTNNELRTSVISEKTINILPNSLNDKLNINTIENKDKNSNSKIFNQKNLDENKDNSIIWKIISISLTILWLITIFLWYRNNYYSRKILNNSDEDKLNKKNASLKEATKRLKKEIKSGTPETLNQALINWSKLFWYKNPPIGLEQIAERLPETSVGINKLNSLLYYKNNNKITMLEVQKEFRDIKFNIKKRNNSKVNESYLAKIYPDDY